MSNNIEKLIDLEKMLALSTVHIYWLDNNNVYQGCNDLQAKSAGLLSRFDIIGKRNVDLPWHKDHQDIVKKIDEINMDVINSGIPKFIEETTFLLSGNQAIFLSHKLPLKNKNGKVLGLLGISIDITNQKLQQDKLKNEKEEAEFTLEYIISHVPAHIYWKNKKGVYLGANESQAKSLGFSSGQDLVGKTDFDLPGEKENAEKFRENDMKVMHTGKEIVVEETPKIDGKPSVVLSQKLPLRNKNGETSGIIGISIDITDRKKMEEQLKEAMVKAELANKVKDEFLKNMSHDMRTALSGIQGSSELLEKEIIDIGQVNNKAAHEHIDNLIASCRALTHIHNQILHAIHVFSGDIPTYKNKFDLQGKLKGIINLHRAKATEKDLQLNLRYDKKIPKYLVGDCRKLTAIAIELTSNALKYTNEGKVTLNAELEKIQGDKVIIKFSVRDSGIGIPEEKKNEIFSRFQRISPAYEGKYLGLGLGLSVVKQFVDDLGGEIYVASNPKEGAVFTCYLPFMKSLSNDNQNVDNNLDLPLPDMEIGDVSIRPVIKKAIAKRLTSLNNIDTTPTILHVEDEKICALIIQEMLKNFGFKIDLATNGADALRKFKNNNYALVLMDVGLPDVSGIEVTRKMRVEEKITGAHTPIIALTAHFDIASKQQCIESGMDAVLSKPVASKNFFEILKAFIPNCAEKFAIKNATTTSKKTSKTTNNNTATTTAVAIDKEIAAVLATPEGPVLDFEYMKNNFWYDVQNTKQLLKKTAAPSLSQEVKRLKEANVRQDWDLVQNIAHKMSGACGSCGLLRLQAVCRRLEIYLRGRNSKATQSLINLLISEYKDACAAIKGL